MKSQDFHVPNQSDYKLFGLDRGHVLLIVIVLIGALGTLAGCNKIIRRGQSPDNIRRFADNSEKKTTYVNDVCAIWGLNFAKVEGIGLAGNLSASGSNPRPSGQRDYLLKELKSRTGNEKPKTLVASKNTSMVLIKGLLPPGIRKGERFDVEVTTMTPPKPETTSLRNGMLLQTRLRPMVPIGRSVKQGHVVGLAKGPILIDALFESRQDEPNRLRGWILGGGVAMEDRPLGLTVRTESTSTRTTRAIAYAINDRFSTVNASGRDGVATPKTDRLVELVVPDEYRHNVGRYLQVVVNIAINESTAERVNRLEQLDREIADPTLAETAAIRLEAFGKEGIPALRRALRHPDMEVRFYVAEALAYMGQSDGVDVLQMAAETEPAFRWHALTALASLDHIAAGSALAELMQATSAETRYGAFRALHARSPHDPAVSGKTLANDFFFHVVPSKAVPMLHFARSKRPEIVIFGENQSVTDDFLYVESGLTVKAIDDGRVRVIRFSALDGEQRKVCTRAVADLIQTLAEVGCDYGTLLTIFRDAKKNDMLESRLVVNAVPRIGTKSKSERADGQLPPEQSERFISGPPPELFRDSDGEEASSQHASTLIDSASQAKNPANSRSVWSKMKGWFAN